MFSNQTPNFGLPQYAQNDTLNVLSDFNGAMETIDSTMKSNELAAASAQSKADGADTKANNNAAAITDLQTAQGADRTDINTLTGAVNTINSLIGNGEPTTTDKTLIGAINELHSDVTSLDELWVVKELTHSIRINADGVKTNKVLMGEVSDAALSYFATLGDDERALLTEANIGASGAFCAMFHEVFNNSSTRVDPRVFRIGSVDGRFDFLDAIIGQTSLNNAQVRYCAVNNDDTITVNDLTNAVPTSDKYFELKFTIYKKINL